jgi:hypothetical protein
MVEKPRYQVFVSSTYADLKAERADIIDVLMKLDCIPAGMEIFPAFDDETLEYIKRIIDLSDYYVLIIAGRYGSLSSDGLSFTEKEYEYTVSKGIPVLAFIHGSPDRIPIGDTDRDPDKAALLHAFIERVKRGRIVKFWNHPSELSKEVTVALSQTMARKPGIGWVRANVAASVGLIAAEQQHQAEDIEMMKLVLNLVLPEVERWHLAGLATDEKTYLVRVTKDIAKSFEAELRHLLGLELVERRDNKHLRDFFTEEGGEDRDLKEYLKITPKGRNYIDRYQLFMKTVPKQVSQQIRRQT